MPRPASRRLRLESLESRQLMAYDIDFSGGVFDIEGGSGNDYINIFYNLNTAQNKVVVEVRDLDTNQLLLREERPVGEVTRIVARGFDGDDAIGNSTSVPMRAFGGNGYDSLGGGSGNDELFGESGPDNLTGGPGRDLLEGGGGSDQLEGDQGNDTLRGGSDDDLYLFYSDAGGDDVLEESGTAESNTLYFASYSRGVRIDLSSTAAQSIGTGISLRMTSPQSFTNISGTSFDDVLIGNSRDNRLFGSIGHDQLFGRAGNDELRGSSGNDLLVGEGGNDVLHGEAGNDRYQFGPGNLGADTIKDSLSGANEGSDTLDFSGFGQGVAINLNNSLAVDNALLKLTLQDGAFLENVTGSAFNDTTMGNALANVLQGLGGNDYFRAGAGNDSISGGLGADIVYAEEGNDKITSDAADTIYGGLGTDTFDGWSESSWLPIKNPRPTRYRDWGVR